MNWAELNTFLQSVITIFAIVDPVGSLPIFVGLTEGVNQQERRRVFRLAGVIAFALICIMAIAGQYILKGVFGLGLDEFRVGGGLLLILVGVQGIMERPKKGQTPATPEPQAVADVTNALAAEHVGLAVSPIAVPLLAGPGAIVTVMLIANRESATYGPVGGVLYALAACSVCFIFVLAILNWAHVVFRLLGRIGTIAVARVMDIFIVAIGVRFIFDGTFNYIAQHLPRLGG